MKSYILTHLNSEAAVAVQITHRYSKATEKTTFALVSIKYVTLLLYGAPTLPIHFYLQSCQICSGRGGRIALNPPVLALYVRITVTGVFSGSPGPALQYVGVETIVGELSSELRYLVFK
jgi:hypothetical protein